MKRFALVTRLALSALVAACGGSRAGSPPSDGGAEATADGPVETATGSDAGPGKDGSVGDGGGDAMVPQGCLAPGDPAFYATPAVVGSGVRTVNVSPTSNPSLSQAFAGAQPGDTIVLAAGTYTQSGGNLVLSASGTPAKWITIQAAAGATPLLDLAGAGELSLGGSYVLLEGLEIEHGGGNNLHVAPVNGSVQDVIVRGCKIHDLTSGPGAAIKINSNNTINAGVSLVYIEGNDLSGSIGNAIVDAVATEKSVARGNYIHDNDLGDHGIFFKGGSSEILIENNLVRGIRSNAAIQLGGATGSTFFDPAHPDVEGFDELARNNLVSDCDDAVVQVEGCAHARIDHNTVVSQTGFAIFRLNQGSSSTGAPSDNSDVEITNNLVLATLPSMADGVAGGPPQYARDDGNATAVAIARELWGGAFINSASPGPGIPMFPQAGDVVVAAGALGTVVSNPSPTGIVSLQDALGRFALVAGSPAKAAGVPDARVICDITGAPRSATMPSIGAFE
ncbi:MAG TPA: right-handed parallel beta-helix repeat-containing protein [Polyangiaceae bacterium]